MKNLKLNQLNANALNEREMRAIQGGGGACGCGCAYASSGGSINAVNMCANSQKGLVSSGKIEDWCSVGATGSWGDGYFYWSADWYTHCDGGC